MSPGFHFPIIGIKLTPIIREQIREPIMAHLSSVHTTMAEQGVHPTDDSIPSEQALTNALPAILTHAQQKARLHDGTIDHVTTMSLYDLKNMAHAHGGPAPTEEDRRVSIKPDGGIILLIIRGEKHPLLIIEDKCQGTNDTRLAEGKKKQALGNAIERAFKNINAAKMMCIGSPCFPYAIFASGCDFHHTETIAQRLEAGNMGYPNHYLDMSHNGCILNWEALIPQIDVKKHVYSNGLQADIASVFVKAHKWDDGKHGSSRWTTEEYQHICCHIIDQAMEAIVNT